MRKVYVVSFEWATEDSHNSWARPFLNKQQAVDEYKRQLKELKTEGWEADALKDRDCIKEPVYEEDTDRCTYVWSERKLGNSCKCSAGGTVLASFGIYEFGYEASMHSYLRLEEYDCEE